MSMGKGLFRLVGLDGNPHPVLDTIYESKDSAVWAAKDWSSGHTQNTSIADKTIGIEVKTVNGSWRTIGYS